MQRNKFEALLRPKNAVEINWKNIQISEIFLFSKYF